MIAVGGDGVAGPACSLLIDDLTTTWARLTSASGTATVPLPIPPSPTLIGVALWLQAGVFDPAATTSALSGLALSQGLRITVGS